MKKFAIIGITMLVLFAVTGTTFAAGFGGQGKGTGQPMLDPSGTVTDVSHYAVGEGPSQGDADSYILFRSTNGQEIHLVFGPSWYLDQKGVTLVVGDSLTVTDTNEADGDLVVISFLKDGQTVTLRDETGRPLWAGSRGTGMERLSNGSGTAISGMDRPFNGRMDGAASSGQAGASSGMICRGNNSGEPLCNGTCANCVAS